MKKGSWPFRHFKRDAPGDSLRVIRAVEGGIGRVDEARSVEQYALVAKRGGIFPVLSRGSQEAARHVPLKRGDVWKYGTTAQPARRYSEF